MEVTIKIPDMTCEHCKMTIEKAIKGVPGVDKFQLELSEKVVKVSGEIEVSQLITTIQAAGYKADEILKLKP